MSDVVPPRIGLRWSSRVVARALSAVLGVFAIWAVVDSGLEALVGALGCLAAAAYLARVARMEVRATPTELRVVSLWRTERIPWSQIEGFRARTQEGDRRVLVLVNPDRVVDLPVANGMVLFTTRKEVEAVRDRLEEYRLSRA
jgi:hypothetical protein